MRRPNVIVFFTDQQRWDTSGLHGNPLDLTPNFDAMAQAGTHLAQTFTCQPVCGPARSCLQTGMYATETGCWRNGIQLNPELRTLAHFFRAAGHDTAYIGKWHLGPPGEKGPVPAASRGGYDYWLASNTLEFTSDAYSCVMYDNDDQAVKLPGYRVDAQTDAAIRYIDGHQEDPFFLFLSYIEPHHQNHLDDYPPPEGYRERYAGRWTPPDLAALGGSTQQHLGGYYGMVKRLDEALGRLRDALRSLDLLDDTIILYTSDHGCHFKTRNNEYKRSCHESSIRVPTAISGPGFNNRGRVDKLVSLVDLPPTLLDAAGLPIPRQMQGDSILSIVKDPEADWQEEVFVQISESQVARSVRTQRWKYCVEAPGLDGGEKPAADTYVESELYDLAYDPYELTNLIGLESHRQTCDILRERLIRRIVMAREPQPVIENASHPREGFQRHVTEAEAKS